MFRKYCEIWRYADEQTDRQTNKQTDIDTNTLIALQLHYYRGDVLSK